ncbi:MAG: AraC family transcriptional regulator [Kofleriaceae bacterium]
MRLLPLPARREFMTAESSIRGLHCAEAVYPPGMMISMHAHNNASITVIAAGGVDEQSTTDENACERGVVIVRPAGEPHANRIGRRGVVNVEVDLDANVLEEHRTRVTRARIASLPTAIRHAVRLRAALRDQSATRSLLVESAALELVAAVFSDRSRASAAMAHAYARIRDEFRSALSIAELAREAGMHPVSFARAFRASYGMSPGALVRELRVAWAAEQLIARPDATIADIAAEAGYCDQSHLSRALVATFGRSASQLRR